MNDEPLRTLVGGTSLALGLPFLAGALAKLRDPARFLSVVQEYRLVPERLVPLVAVGLIMAELAVAVLLASGVAIAFTAMFASLLCLAFLAAVLINLGRHRTIPCGCFGGDEGISGRTVLRLLTMTGGGVFTCVGALVVREAHTLSDPSQFLGRAALGIPAALLGSWIVTLPELAELLVVQPNRRPVPSGTSEASATS